MEDFYPAEFYNNEEHFGDAAELDIDPPFDYGDDGQPTEYEEWQDYMGGDDWDHGQFDEYNDW